MWKIRLHWLAWVTSLIERKRPLVSNCKPSTMLEFDWLISRDVNREATLLIISGFIKFVIRIKILDKSFYLAVTESPMLFLYCDYSAMFEAAFSSSIHYLSLMD